MASYWLHFLRALLLNGHTWALPRGSRCLGGANDQCQDKGAQALCLGVGALAIWLLLTLPFDRSNCSDTPVRRSSSGFCRREDCLKWNGTWYKNWQPVLGGYCRTIVLFQPCCNSGFGSGRFGAEWLGLSAVHKDMIWPPKEPWCQPYWTPSGWVAMLIVRQVFSSSLVWKYSGGLHRSLTSTSAKHLWDGTSSGRGEGPPTIKTPPYWYEGEEVCIKVSGM